MAVSWVALVTETAAAALPLKVTEAPWAKPVPASVTTVPAAPCAGVKPVMVGALAAWVTVKVPLETARPFRVIRVMVPVWAPLGTTTVAWEALTTATSTTRLSWNTTTAGALNPAPMRVTVVPTVP